MTGASSAESPPAPAGRPRRTARGLWLAVAAGFALLVAAWAVAVHFARQAQIRDVPVARPGGRP